MVLAALQLAALALAEGSQCPLIFGEQFLPEPGGNSGVWSFVGHRAALLDRLLEAGQKCLARLAAIDVLFELFTERTVQFIV